MNVIKPMITDAAQKIHRFPRSITWLFSVAVVILAIITYTNRSGMLTLPGKSAELTEIRPEAGFAYIARTGHQEFSSHEKPSRAQVLENGKPLGPANDLHDHIRTFGLGSFSFWHEDVYFSTSDNSDPRSNGKTYSIYYPFVFSDRFAYSLYGISLLLCMSMVYRVATNPDAAVYVKKTIMKPEGMFMWIYRNILPGLIITAGILSIIILGGEWILRRTQPFNAVNWPSQFDENYGFIFIPGETVRYTNHSDFWTEAKVNSLGFLDREPPQKISDASCRIVFIGDSFVEAVQVDHESKLQTVFEAMADERNPDMEYQTAAFGYSGTGQINQMPYYEYFARPLQPDVVVLVVVSNDFANNSTLLESIRNGWHPYHPPRLFYEIGRTTQEVNTIEIDPEWQKYLLPEIARVEPNISTATTRLTAHSYLYTWMNINFFNASADFATFLTGNPPIQEIYRFRLDMLKKTIGHEDEFGAWDPRDTFFENMFLEENPPPVFQEAISLTGFAFDQYKAWGERDDFNLLILTASNVTTIGGDGKMFNLIDDLAQKRDIPVIDQYAFMQQAGISDSDITWKFDSHWNQLGHRIAAEALWEYFEANPGMCK